MSLSESGLQVRADRARELLTPNAEHGDIRGPLCPECGEPMARERRLTIGGRVPWRCPNRHLAVDEAETARKAACGYVYIGGSRS